MATATVSAPSQEKAAPMKVVEGVLASGEKVNLNSGADLNTVVRRLARAKANLQTAAAAVRGRCLKQLGHEGNGVEAQAAITTITESVAILVDGPILNRFTQDANVEYLGKNRQGTFFHSILFGVDSKDMTAFLKWATA